MTPEQLEKLSLIELESLAYRQVSALETARQNLAVLSQFIAKKQQEDKE